ncbi:hypothetical protein ACFSGX_15855 [Sphingomonas arantia]|uniref:Uncharacterized protein n=1 Tax=Sphingomonas arantia TaxID=1460676 RepID=A0ABW4U3V6_9SPHN
MRTVTVDSPAWDYSVAMQAEDGRRDAAGIVFAVAQLGTSSVSDETRRTVLF